MYVFGVVLCIMCIVLLIVSSLSFLHFNLMSLPICNGWELHGDFDALIWYAWHTQAVGIPHERLDSKVVLSYQSPPEGLRCGVVMVFERDQHEERSAGRVKQDRTPLATQTRWAVVCWRMSGFGRSWESKADLSSISFVGTPWWHQLTLEHVKLGENGSL